MSPGREIVSMLQRLRKRRLRTSDKGHGSPSAPLTVPQVPDISIARGHRTPILQIGRAG